MPYYNSKKRFYRKSRFRPKKGIRSFRDLYVYERASKTAVEVRKFTAKLKETEKRADENVISSLEETVSEIPLLLARAHSRRFSNEGMEILDDAMELCNRAVVYLEQAAEAHDSVEEAVTEEYIARYDMVRRKIFNLFKSWKKIVKNQEEEQQEGG